jgi:hypothetical protein
MAGEPLQGAQLGWHGLEGDRRLAFRRMNDSGGFPWITASKLPELLLFSPLRVGAATGELPTHVRTPENKEWPLFDEDLTADIGRRYGAPVELMHLRHGVFDDASISVIASETVREIARLTELSPDLRRFRPNVVVRLKRSIPFLEDEWIGGILSFGHKENAPAINVTMHDVRCAVVNFDPDSAKCAPKVMKAIVKANQNHAGVYGTVVRTGQLTIGQEVLFHPPAA